MCFSVVTDYPRRRPFDYYRAYRNPFYSMTVELEATRLKAFVDRHGYRTYLNLCDGFIRAWNDPTDGAPRVAFGNLVERDGGLRVPVGIQVNQCFVDGRALGELVDRVQAAFNAPEG